jgi:hypothetical protein
VCPSMDPLNPGPYHHDPLWSGCRGAVMAAVETSEPSTVGAGEPAEQREDPQTFQDLVSGRWCRKWLI